jgi:hypothetical protein
VSDASELEPALTAPERALAERLTGSRPAPRAAFRGALGRHLAARDPGHGPRPRRLRALASLYLAGGGLLLALGTLLALGSL